MKASFDARALPSRSRDLTLYGKNVQGPGGGGCRLRTFPHPSWRSGRFPALPYPPLR